MGFGLLAVDFSIFLSWGRERDGEGQVNQVGIEWACQRCIGGIFKDRRFRYRCIALYVEIPNCYRTHLLATSGAL